MANDTEEALRPRGRPTLYTPEIDEAICVLLRMGKTLRAACGLVEDCPAYTTILSWVHDGQHPFSEHYARAREVGYPRMADDIIDIADGRGINLDSEDTAVNDPQRDRLRVEARKWLLSKALPKIYGDKIQTEVTGKDGKELLPEPNSRDVARAVLDILRSAKVEDPDGAR